MYWSSEIQPRISFSVLPPPERVNLVLDFDAITFKTRQERIFLGPETDEEGLPTEIPPLLIFFPVHLQMSYS